MELFDNLKMKKEKHIIEADYVFTILNMLQSMFKLNVSDTEVVPEYILTKLWMDGRVGLFKEGNNILIADTVTFSGINTKDIVGDDLIYTKAGSEYSGDVSDWHNSNTFAVLGLNPLYEPDMNVFKFAELLTEVDISMLATVKNSRLANIIKGRSTKEVAQINAVLTKIANGDTQVITDDEFLKNAELEISPETQVIQLFDADKISTIQYLSVFANDCRNRLYNIYGLRAIGSDKIAQQSEAEVNNGSGASFIYPLVIYNKLNSDIEILNRKFNTNWSIELNPIFTTELDSYMNKEGAEKDDVEVIQDEGE